MAIIHINDLLNQVPDTGKAHSGQGRVIPIDELIGKQDPSSVSEGGFNYVKEHPFKTVFEPAAKTLTGKSLEDMAQNATKPKESDYNPESVNYAEYKKKWGKYPDAIDLNPGAYMKNAASGMAGGAADVVTTPGNYIPIPLGKIAKPIAKIKIRNTTVGDLATKLPINKDVVSNAKKMIGEKDFTPILDKNAVAYRQLLNPSKGEIKNNEVKNRKDINDSFKLAAREKLIIEESADKKLNTTKAREALKEKQDVLEEQLQGALATDKQPRFNLEDLKATAKKNLRSQISNDADYLTAAKQVDDEIAAAIQERGKIVTGAELNKVKRGMWSKAYNQSAPTAHKAARQVGNAAKEMIQSGYDNADIKGINQELGKYLNLDTILENAHGRVVNRGKLGRYAAQIIGGVAGAKVPVFGPLAGTWVGGKVSDMIASPERVTGALAKKLKGMPETKFNFRVDPKKTPILGLPKPEAPLPQYLKDRQNIPEMIFPGETKTYQNPIPMKGKSAPLQLPKPENLPKYLKERRNIPPLNDVGEGVIAQGQEKPKALPAPLPKYLQERQVIPKMKIPTGKAESSNPIPLEDKTRAVSKTEIKGGSEKAKPRVIPKNKGAVKKALGVSAVAAGAASSNAQASQPKDEDAILSIVGEVGPYGKEGMDWVAATIKNRNKGLQGVYGKNNPNVIAKKYTQKQYNDAKDAWEKAKKQDVTGGADHWFSDKDLQQDNVKNIIKKDKLIFIKKVGRNNFYKKPTKIKSKKSN